MAKKKKKKPPFSVRLPDELREQLQQLAEKENRTLGNKIIDILKKAVNT